MVRPRDHSKSWLQERGERKGHPDTAARGLFGFTLEHWRIAAGFAATAMLTGGISLSISDHSHRMVSYVFWYGCSGLFIVMVVALTRRIDRRRGGRVVISWDRSGHKTDMNIDLGGASPEIADRVVGLAEFFAEREKTRETPTPD